VAVEPGDRVLGLASSGLHSNGYSLARRAVFERIGLKVGDAFPGTGRSVADELLSPTRIYVKSVLALLRALPVRAMAHVTGGGITENLPRVLPEGCRAVIRPATWPLPPVFRVIQDAGRVDEDEMRRTFNMGLGYLLVVRAEDADGARALLRGAGETVFEVGEIEAGPRGVRYD
jgi:phosphoribosylformylglycinamidine cyclo-ligase